MALDFFYSLQFLCYSSKSLLSKLYTTVICKFTPFFGFNGPFPQWDVPAGNHGSGIHHLGMDVCFGHDSLQAHLMEEIGHKPVGERQNQNTNRNNVIYNLCFRAFVQHPVCRLYESSMQFMVCLIH